VECCCCGDGKVSYERCPKDSKGVLLKIWLSNILLRSPDQLLITTVQLQALYNLVSTLKRLSGLGCKWTDEQRMNIGVADAAIWAEYTTVH
jgi:hypothetical protein